MVRYRQTVVGAAWTLLQPLSMMAVFTIFFGILAAVPSQGVPYPVFVYAGLLVYQIAAKILNEGATSVVNNAPLLGKIYFPRAFLPLSVAFASLVDLLFSLIAFVPLLLFYGIIPGPQVVLLPLFLGIGWAGAVGVTLWLAALNARYRDVTQLLPFLSQIWMFVSPVIYSSTIVPASFVALFWLNPLAIAIDGMRWTVTGIAPPLEEWIIGATMAIVLLVSGYVFFRRREASFPDVV
jgi:lipopolysaccharide transport system permease protein